MLIRTLLRLATLPLALAALCSAAPAQSPQASQATYGQAGPAVGWGAYGRRPSPRAPLAVWVPGSRQRVERTRWVPGGTRREWIPARTRRVCGPWGTWREVVVEPGRWVLVPIPGYQQRWFETVWVPGHWTTQAH